MKANLVHLFSKEDGTSKGEKIRAVSLLIGMIIGSLVGVPLSIFLGLLRSPGFGLPPLDFIGNLKETFSFFGLSIVLGCVIAFVSSIFFWRKGGRVDLGNCALSSLTVLFVWVSVSFIMTFVFVPVNVFLLQYLTPASVFWYVMLAFFPFMILIAYVSFPSLRSRIRHVSCSLIKYQFWSEIRKDPMRHKKMLFLTTVLVIIIVVDILRALYT
jgi:hypothetical protein